MEAITQYFTSFTTMTPKEIVAQIFGLLVTVVCLISPQCKKNWQMALMAILANGFSVLNYLLLDEVSACGVCAVAVIQAVFAIRHTKRGTKAGTVELCVFGALYVLGGLLPYMVAGTFGSFAWRDVLPIVGALLYLLYLAEKREQRMRLFALSNAVLFLIYDILVQSTHGFAQLISIVSILIALMRYRNRKSDAESEE